MSSLGDGRVPAGDESPAGYATGKADTPSPPLHFTGHLGKTRLPRTPPECESSEIRALCVSPAHQGPLDEDSRANKTSKGGLPGEIPHLAPNVVRSGRVDENSVELLKKNHSSTFGENPRVETEISPVADIAMQSNVALKTRVEIPPNNVMRTDIAAEIKTVLAEAGQRQESHSKASQQLPSTVQTLSQQGQFQTTSNGNRVRRKLPALPGQPSIFASQITAGPLETGDGRQARLRKRGAVAMTVLRLPPTQTATAVQRQLQSRLTSGQQVKFWAPSNGDRARQKLPAPPAPDDQCMMTPPTPTLLTRPADQTRQSTDVRQMAQPHCSSGVAQGDNSSEQAWARQRQDDARWWAEYNEKKRKIEESRVRQQENLNKIFNSKSSLEGSDKIGGKSDADEKAQPVSRVQCANQPSITDIPLQDSAVPIAEVRQTTQPPEQQCRIMHRSDRPGQLGGPVTDIDSRPAGHLRSADTAQSQRVASPQWPRSIGPPHSSFPPSFMSDRAAEEYCRHAEEALRQAEMMHRQTSIMHQQMMSVEQAITKSVAPADIQLFRPPEVPVWPSFNARCRYYSETRDSSPACDAVTYKCGECMPCRYNTRFETAF